MGEPGHDRDRGPKARGLHAVQHDGAEGIGHEDEPQELDERAAMRGRGTGSPCPVAGPSRRSSMHRRLEARMAEVERRGDRAPVWSAAGGRGLTAARP